MLIDNAIGFALILYMSIASIAFYILAGMLLYLSFRSFRGGIDYLNYFKQELSKPRSDFTPFATIFAPCKGLDEGLAGNLTALVEQDYPEFEVIFVVDNENDAAVRVIEDVSGVNEYDAKGSKLIVASRATDSSQKVENLREAVLHADPRSKVFAFVDSDARPAKDWLMSLTAPLEDESVGAASGYRWFTSERLSLGSELRSAWNASIASALGPNRKSNFCWGGSMAIRREIFERLDLREKWRGTLSDDFAITRALNAADLPISFVPQALTPTIETCTLREAAEFTTRQMKITRVYMPQLWLVSFVGSGLFTLVMISAFLIVMFSKQNTALVWAAVATLLFVSAFSIGKAWLRLKAVRMVLTSVKDQSFTQLTLWLLTPPLFFYNCVAALFSREIKWRGIRYLLVSANETRRLDRES